MRFIALAILIFHLPLLCLSRTMDIPSELEGRVITVAFERMWGLPGKDRLQPEFALAAYDQIKLVRAAINSDPATPAWMKADKVGVISIDEAKAGVRLEFPDSLTAQEIHQFHLQFIRFHTKAMFDAEQKVVDGLEKVIGSTKASIETERDPIRRRLLTSILEKAQEEWRSYHAY